MIEVISIELKDYVVYVPSLWYTPHYVKAKTKQEAIRRVLNGKAMSSDSAEYERQLEPKEQPWPVERQQYRIGKKR